MIPPLFETVPVVRVEGQEAVRSADEVAVEAPLEVRLDGEAVAVTMRTPGPPGSDEELAAGLLLAEGLIRSREQLASVAPCPRAASGSVVNAFSAAGHRPDRSGLARRGPIAASCGICGKATLEAIEREFPPLPRAGGAVEAAWLAALPSRLAQEQPGFAATGGVHAAGLFFADGAAVIREDVGRHNAVDKVLGRALLDGRLPATDAVLFETGRVSFEIVQKALAAGVPVLAAVGPPTSLAVDLAEASRITLVGFLRGRRMNVYSSPDRVTPIRTSG